MFLELCNTLRYSAKNYGTLLPVTAPCKNLRYSTTLNATFYGIVQQFMAPCHRLQHYATRCLTLLQHYTTSCKILLQYGDQIQFNKKVRPDYFRCRIYLIWLPVKKQIPCYLGDKLEAFVQTLKAFAARWRNANK